MTLEDTSHLSESVFSCKIQDSLPALFPCVMGETFAYTPRRQTLKIKEKIVSQYPSVGHIWRNAPGCNKFIKEEGNQERKER